MKVAIRVIKKTTGRFRAYCPALPGCWADGLTHEDAVRAIHRAVEGYLASMNVVIPADLVAQELSTVG